MFTGFLYIYAGGVIPISPIVFLCRFAVVCSEYDIKRRILSSSRDYIKRDSFVFRQIIRFVMIFFIDNYVPACSTTSNSLYRKRIFVSICGSEHIVNHRSGFFGGSDGGNAKHCAERDKASRKRGDCEA